ncbi:hypothetical protein [Lysinibacillus sp. NPDC093692]|uniref:hypothetical protein n=1 Tax=Lysinibacillus sp. NPDC093692 TaxID=3390578 RepID=UPI003CFBFB70
MDIETLHTIATYYFEKVKTNCDYRKIIHYKEEKGNYSFYALYKCKRGIGLKKVILTPDGDLVEVISL